MHDGMPNRFALDKLIAVTLRLPCDRPFSAREARELGIKYDVLRAAVSAGLLRHPIRGVYASPCLVDDLDHRIAVLRLVVPPDYVVTDRTAAWLWGAELALAPGDHLSVPLVSVFAPPGRRLRTDVTASGERMLPGCDIVELNGLMVTTPLRTACDLGRLLHRDYALAAMDALLRLARFSVEELITEALRFKGYRGVVQLRVLAPLVDGGAQSPQESILRLRWIDVGLPTPETQIEVPAPGGGWYYLDLGNRERRLAAEYDGPEFHGADRADHDQARRSWATDTDRWTIVVARKHNIHGRDQDIHVLLRQANQRALHRLLLR